MTSINPSNIETIYEYSKKAHIHNTIVVVNLKRWNKLTMVKVRRKNTI